MNRNTTCSECSGKMQRGFIVETEISGNPLDSTFWLEGEPEKGWLGLKTKGKQAFHITAFRCESCGFLKLYAETNVPPNK